MTAALEVVCAGPLTTVQDRGRFGHRAAGVSPSGAADLGAMARANHLAGNAAGAAVLEVTVGGLVLVASGRLTVAVAGAACGGVTMDAAIRLEAGQRLQLGAATAGLRAYVAVAGGVAVPAVLGSRSTDTLSGLGPPHLQDGDSIPVGAACIGGAAVSAPPPVPPRDSEAPLLVLPGPRDGWLDGHGWDQLRAATWTASPDSNRTAVRLQGDPLPVRSGSLPPEPLVRGAVQLPPGGLPIVFLADHPVTGGYPVVGVLDAASCDRLAQLRPGQAVRLSVRGGWAPPSR